MITLYQFPISHFCEKVRWTLDYKQIDHKVKNLLPGIHVKTIKKLARRSSVPVLVHDDKAIQGSSEIISYLDEQFPERSLTPENNQLKNQALEWEKYADDELGIHVRLYCYHFLLEHPKIVVPFLAHNGPWYGKFLLSRMFPKLKIRMRQLMNINEESAQTSKEHIETAINKLYNHYQEHKFLVGEQFSRADLTAASMLAPLCRADGYGLDWPEHYPRELEEFIKQFGEKIYWVNKIYEEFR